MSEPSVHRYHTEVDVESATSHALVVDLVGRDRRVLDVGCATGAVAAVLSARGCRVVGIEMDEGAALEAKQYLADLVIGRIEQIDLRSQFADERFDAIIVADVLEHLEDPDAVLRDLVSLLDPGGFVVASIPNVAHGAVRLALLQGRFQYSEVGLLDRTHLRFFTRDTLEALFERAGLVPVDMRRTTAGFFETEIALRAEDFDQKVLDAIAADPEATTYQFVVKAVPEDGSRELRELHREAEARRVRVIELEHEVARLEGELRAGLHVRWPTATTQVGLWGTFDTGHPGELLRLAVHRRELQRRLPNAHLRVFAPYGHLRDDFASYAPGLVIEALGSATPERSEAVARELDAVVVMGPVTSRLDELARRYGEAAAAPDHPALLLAKPFPAGSDWPPVVYSDVSATLDVASTGDRDLAAAMAAAAITATSDARLCTRLRQVDTDCRQIPDSLALVPRVLDRATVARFQREVLLGRAYVVVHVGTAARPAFERLLAALRRLGEERPELLVVGANLDGTPGEGEMSAALVERFPGAIPVADIDRAEAAAAVLAGAALVVSSSAWVSTIASAYGVPSLSLDRPDSPALADQGILVELAKSTVVDDGAAGRLDTYFDEVAERLRAVRVAEGDDVRSTVDDRLAAYASALAAEGAGGEAARALAHERLLALRDAVSTRDREVARAEALKGERDATVSELAAIHGSRSWRMLGVLRSARARLRRF
jgi:2-polyprenyl-3-methyl-5-hydroxy-6-metoxy-1,4-benzoquinol methylase